MLQAKAKAVAKTEEQRGRGRRGEAGRMGQGLQGTVTAAAICLWLRP
ncbi:hypothetical protein ACFXB3_02340 [Streptomyces sp. NPDC059447]